MTSRLLVLLLALFVLYGNALNVDEQQTLQTEAESENSADFCQKIAKRPKYELGEPGKTKLTLKFEQLVELCKQLPRTKTDRIFYHWSDWHSCIRWSMNMRIDQGEMDFLASQHQNQAAGGGFYIAGNPRTSRSYGPCVTYVLILKNTPQYDEAVTRKVLGLSSSLSLVQKAQLGNIIPFIHYYNSANDWYVIHHHALATRVRGGPLDPLSGRNPDVVRRAEDREFDKARVPYNFDKVLSRMDIFKIMYRGTTDDWDSIEKSLAKDNLGPKANVLRDSLNFLKSAMLLLDYFDGLSLLRAIARSPQNPWSQFDPEHFEGFKSTFESYMMKAVTSPNKGVLGISFNRKYGDGKSNQLTWAKNMAETFLPKLYADMAKAPVPYRSEEVRAGGDFENKEFETTPFQIQVMQANPLLEVYARKVNESYRAHYFYPDAKHFRKLFNNSVMIMGSGVVRQTSDSLWLKKPGCTDAKTCTQLQNELIAGGSFGPQTKKLVEQLVLNYFYRIYGKDVTYETETGMGIIVDLVGIHPCNNFNGRTTRFFSMLAHVESNLDPPTSFVSDFDLVTTRRLYSTFVQSSTKLYHKLRQQMISKMLHTVLVRGVKAENRHYWDLPGFRGLVRSLEVFLGPKFVWPPLKGSMNPFWEMVRQRQFISALTMLNGGKTGWNGYAGQTNVDYTIH